MVPISCEKSTISPTGLVNKYTFDGADRRVMQYAVDAGVY